MKSKVQDELKQHFRPEFLNRIDDIVVFHQLTQEEIITIVDLMLAKLDERLRDKDMGLELTQPAKDLLAKKGYDPVLGARPLRRTIQREIEDVLSEKILFGEVRPGQIVLVGTEGEGERGDLHLRRRAEGGAARRAPGRGDRGHAGVAPAGTTTQGRLPDATTVRVPPLALVRSHRGALARRSAEPRRAGPTHEVAGDLGHGGHAGEGHREVELGQQVLEHGAHAVGAGQREAVDVGPAHADRGCAPSASAVTMSAPLRMPLSISTGTRPSTRSTTPGSASRAAMRGVDLPAAVVGDHDPVDPGVQRAVRVVGGEQSLHQDRQRRHRPQRRQVGPGERGPREHLEERLHRRARVRRAQVVAEPARDRPG